MFRQSGRFSAKNDEADDPSAKPADEHRYRIERITQSAADKTSHYHDNAAGCSADACARIIFKVVQHDDVAVHIGHAVNTHAENQYHIHRLFADADVRMQNI